MGRLLLRAAELNPIDGTTVIPKVTLRLTRLDPTTNEDGSIPDPRIAQTLGALKGMGIDVELGQRTFIEPSSVDPCPVSFVPTTNINLDLSVLIALISDLTHAPLPHTIEEANRRFVPPQEYREWKQRRQAMTGKVTNGDTTLHSVPDTPPENNIKDLPDDLITHARALTNQLLQEMSTALLQDLHEKIQLAPSASNGSVPLSDVVFWTTTEARERCMRIVSKIGGAYEKRRARALFCLDPANLDAEVSIGLEDARRLYWQDSRFPVGFIPLLPLQIYPASSPSVLAVSNESIARRPKSTFGASLSQVCTDILAQEPHPSASEMSSPSPVCKGKQAPEIQRAAVTKANPRLTAHTVQSMHWGAELGWTTLTANRSSIKAILRELKGAKIAGRLVSDDACTADRETDRNSAAAIWIIDPRSLAEGMSSVPSSTEMSA